MSFQLLESLNLVLVVGLAVDYCVHLAEGYSRSAHVDRKLRTRDALSEVGLGWFTINTCVEMGFAVQYIYTEKKESQNGSLHAMALLRCTFWCWKSAV